MAERTAEEIFKEFKEQSIADFFKKNRQMLGYAGKVHSLVTILHEYVTNSLDACEEAGILPEVEVTVQQVGDEKYKVSVKDNGPGIPRKYIGKALGQILSGTKFHRYMQQRGQQGIGAAGCTLFSQITTGKYVFAKSATGNRDAYSCHIGIDTAHNKPIVADMQDINGDEMHRGLYIEGEFAEVKYENSEHSVYEYLRRTALSNPHLQIKFTDPDNKEYTFVRATDIIPERPKPTKPHPLGLTVNDLLEFAQKSESRRVSSFLLDTFARMTANKLNEIKLNLPQFDMDKDPKKLTWIECEELIKTFNKIKWIAPDAMFIKPIGEEQIKIALKNIIDPEFMNVTERKPAVFRGGVPFVVEAAIAFGGNAGRKTEEGYEANVLRYANRVPLLFDSGNCAISEAVKSIDWKRYGIDLEQQPVSILVNVSSIYIPYSGVGKESIAQEDEIIDEIKLALMETARGLQRYLSGKMHIREEESKYNVIMRYTKQLASDLSSISGIEKSKIEKDLEALVARHYPKVSRESTNEINDGNISENESV
ncbi:MAG: DNA topoisomerase VI subunit B [Candidatus Micrarchaeia archaeon]